MANIFTLENIEDFSEKLNIDELYEKKRQYDLTQLALFNKVLNRIHVRIKTVSRQRKDEQFCWYVVPEVIIGVPKYDQSACIAYLIDKLKKFNGLKVAGIHFASPQSIISQHKDYEASENCNNVVLVLASAGPKFKIANTEYILNSNQTFIFDASLYHSLENLTDNYFVTLTMRINKDFIK